MLLAFAEPMTGFGQRFCGGLIIFFEGKLIHLLRITK